MKSIKILKAILFIVFILNINPVVYSQTINKNKDNILSKIINNLSMPVNGRFDYEITKYRNEVEGFNDNPSFRMSSLVVLLNGTINNNLSFDFRQVFDQTGIDQSGIPYNIQVASLNFKTSNQRWIFKLGKFFESYGTNEQQYWPSEVYRYSYINSNVSVWKSGIHAEYTSKSGQQIGG
ncbi:porin [Flammeovirga kamogawensis]|uniref:Uncharacterized protein n=1 Tax=Flammeovirga kamogawensis TaxID=373891 RepID=A0ABX8H308_9BACT|nr:porin [Flammeovirga kamogawensis]MBB6460192.1 hypothetical protein [Flammeovirga kamogawensis]QWG10004.1 hypothetical protein KM029_20190 [Flammeovirga kamogawensis]TRX65512.1 hypothetical protein EO216_23620 [Flammeovirga kamogawensis]